MTAAFECAQVWAAALVGAGVREVVVSPGARSGPLAVAAALREELEIIIHHDERAASFLALGLARGSSRPVAFVCSSGSAGANAYPAVVEAAATSTPLIVCTADRPATLQNCGAPQVMEQHHLFGSFVVDEASVPVVPDQASWEALVETTTARLLWRAKTKAGPVHLNISFDEPLLPSPQEWRSSNREPTRWFSGDAQRAILDATDFPWWQDWVAARRRVIVAGSKRLERAQAQALLRLSRMWGAPVIADPVSGVRELATAHDLVITAGHALLSSAEIAAAMTPDFVLRFGGICVSRQLTRWASAEDLASVSVAAGPDVADPHRSARWTLSATAAELLDAMLAQPTSPHDEPWRQRWESLEAAARDAIEQGLSSCGAPDLIATRALWDKLGAADHLQAASSMAVRYVDLVAGVRQSPGGSVASSRGLNGIDGTIATAWGEGVGRAADSTWCLLGDLAFLHDVGSLTLRSALPHKMRVVVLQNDGGGIFHHLPFAGESSVFERVFGTPHGQLAAPLAAAAGWAVYSAHSAAEVASALDAAAAEDGPALVEVHSSRADSEAAWAKLMTAAQEAALQALEAPEPAPSRASLDALRGVGERWSRRDYEVRGELRSVARWGSEDPKGTVVALHGFGGHPLDFEALAAELMRAAPELELVAPLLGGHSRGDWHAGPARSMDDELRSLDELLVGALRPGSGTARPVYLLGYSMGARLSLHLLSRGFIRWERAALVGARPPLPSAQERQERRAHDERWAALLEREGMAEFERQWAKQAVIASRAQMPSPWGERWLARRLLAEPGGLAESLRLAGTGAMSLDDSDLKSITTPTLAITGAEDQKFLGLADKLAASMPALALSPPVQGAGHAAHVEAAPEVAQRLADYFKRDRNS